MRIGLKKCFFLERSIKFLGFLVDGETVSVDKSRFVGLSKYIKVSSVKELQRALGFLGYFRKFVKDYAGKVNRLFAMVSGKAKFSSEAEEICNRIREEIVEAEPLFLPDMDSPFVIECDASNIGVGAVLVQYKGKEKRIVSFGGRKLIAAELNYSTIEKELLAIIFGVKRYRFYLSKRFKDSNSQVSQTTYTTCGHTR